MKIEASWYSLLREVQVMGHIPASDILGRPGMIEDMVRSEIARAVANKIMERLGPAIDKALKELSHGQDETKSDVG